MNIDNDLKERMTQMSADVPGGPSLQRVIRQGRARRRRRAVAAVGSGVATVCAVGVVAGAALTGVGPFGGDDPTETEPEWVLALPPEKVPYAIERAVREQLPDDAKITHTELEAYGKGPKPLPESEWDEATSWHGTFKFGGGEQLAVGLDHSRGDTEGNDRKNCAQDDKMRYYSCEYSELDTGEHVMERAMTARRSDGPWYVGVNPDQVRPGRLWFMREVVIEPGGDYMVEISNYVKAESREQAAARWTLDVDAMRRVIARGEFLEDPSDS